MTNNVEKISYDNFDYESQYASYTCENGNTIMIRNTITLAQMMVIVNGVVSACFDRESGAYIPEFKDCAIRAAVISAYTNIEVPTDIEESYDFVYGSGIFEMVVDVINSNQLRSMVDAINGRIRYMVEANAHLINKKVNELYGALEVLADKFGNTFDKLDTESVNKLMRMVSESEEELPRQIGVKNK